MASYEVRFKESVQRELRKIPKKELERILQRIEALGENPRPPGCEKLSTQERYRVRQGDYRIVYEIEDDHLLVIVVKVGHRRSIYDHN